MAEYVYGILERSASAPSGRGIGGAPLRVVSGQTASALVSRVSGDAVHLGRDEMLTHSRVLERALSRGTVLPMRFGVLMETPDDVRERLLDEHSDELSEQLDRMNGKVQMHVRGMYEEEQLMREVVRDEPDIARLRDRMRSGPAEASYHRRINLGERVAVAVERRRDVDAEQIIDSLAPFALAFDLATPAHERVVLNAAFLVERNSVRKFDDALDRIAAEQAGRIRFKCTGPLPPHSFVELAGSV